MKMRLPLSILGLLLLPFLALAQSDGMGVTPPEPAATSSATEVPQATVATSTPTTPRPTPSTTLSPIPTTIIATTTPLGTKHSSVNPYLWVTIGVLAALGIGYGAMSKGRKSEEKEEKSHCFNLKQMLDKKLEELTDLKAQLKSKAEEKIRESAREAVGGTIVGDLLATVERVETEYNRLIKMYEECMLEHSSKKYKGTIVENSLANKDILKKVEAVKTWQTDNWTLHDVLVGESEIDELGKSLASGPWYMHFWTPGTDNMKVVYRDKVFDVKISDKSTWDDAITHGKSLGIPEEQLDFLTT